MITLTSRNKYYIELINNIILLQDKLDVYLYTFDYLCQFEYRLLYSFYMHLNNLAMLKRTNTTNERLSIFASKLDFSDYKESIDCTPLEDKYKVSYS